jgi:hypothetical protein
MYDNACGDYQVNLVKAELGPIGWDSDVTNWMERAQKGPGQAGPHDSKTAYFWNQTSWGGPIMASSCEPTKADKPPPKVHKHVVKHKAPRHVHRKKK